MSIVTSMLCLRAAVTGPNFLRETVGNFYRNVLKSLVVYLTSFKTHTHLGLDIRQLICQHRSQVLFSAWLTSILILSCHSWSNACHKQEFIFNVIRFFLLLFDFLLHFCHCARLSGLLLGGMSSSGFKCQTCN
jgi:hypothetical protein